MDNRGNITFADEYQDLTKETELYTSAAELFLAPMMTADQQSGDEDFSEEEVAMRDWLRIAYCTGKLNGEAGEVAELVFKAFRSEQGVINDDRRKKLILELGDVLWYVARLSDLLGYNLTEVMRLNIEKLFDRKERKKLHGDGDNR